MKLRIRLIIACFLLVASSALAADAKHRTIRSAYHGTINLVLANANGMVVLTDSMVTAGTKPGSPQMPQPAQKLFRLDDSTVCTIAGFLEAWVPAAEMYTNTGAIIREYIQQLHGEQLAGKPPRSIARKLADLAFVFDVRLSAAAALRVAAGRPFDPSEYRMQLIVAGYDTDGSPKIVKVTLTTTFANGVYESSVQNAEMTTMSDKLVHQSGGMPDVAEELLRNPSSEGQDPVLAAYADSEQKDGGQSLTIEQMKALAADLAVYTAKRHPEVGGADQVAVLQGGRLASLDLGQQRFPDATQPILHFGLLEDFGAIGDHAISIGGSILCARCDFSQLHWNLDGDYFVTSTFTDDVLKYDGGPTYFDKTNQVIRSVLVIGPHAKLRTPTVQHLIKDFNWARVEYPGRKPAPRRAS
jgi:20S proteasome alpha/beta subunit